MNPDFTCDCGQAITELECNTCRTKRFAILLVKAGVNINLVSHVIRDIKKREGDNEFGEVICPICNSNLISMCRQCYFSKIKNVVYFHFPQDVSGRILSLSQEI